MASSSGKPDTSLLDALANYDHLEPAIGGALILLVQPKPGLESKYNRWYEDDHYIAGALAWPWVFAGRRWMATRTLFDMAFKGDSTILGDDVHSSFGHIYWLSAGHVADVEYFSTIEDRRLGELGRNSRDRTHLYSHYQDYAGAAYRDPEGPRDVHALNYPYQGLAIEVIDAPDSNGRHQMRDWYLTERAPEVLARGNAAMCVLFTPRPHGQNFPPNIIASAAPIESGRLTVLWFFEHEPTVSFLPSLSDEVDAVDAGGIGRVRFVLPMIPALTGTNSHLDEMS